MIYLRFRLRNPVLLCLLICFFLSGALALRAATHYVVPYNESQADPYTSWDTAGTNIIDVVNAAMTNTTPRTVWVSNGVYVLTNQITITNALALQSTNGPDVTIINGNFTAGASTTNRCMVISNSGAFVSGFTISNGAICDQHGGGVWMSGGILSNCNVRNNNLFSSTNQDWYGAGIYMGNGTVVVCRIINNSVTNRASNGKGSGGGIYSAGNSISDCIISSNNIYGGSVSAGGGGIRGSSLVTIQSSLIRNNYTQNGMGGGVYGYVNMNACTVIVNQASAGGGCVHLNGMITNCEVSYNKGVSYAGGMFVYVSSVAGYYCRVLNTRVIGNTNEGIRMESLLSLNSNLLNNCNVISNIGDGVIMVTTNEKVFNCTISGNQGVGVRCQNGNIRGCLITGNTSNGMLIYSACRTALVSCCTIASNRSGSAGSGLRIEATNAVSDRSFSISSCIIYSNGVAGTDDVFDACAPTNYGTLQYSCIGTNPGFTGAGIITNDPCFADFAGGNYRLRGPSPCINRGSNENWMTNAVDLTVSASVTAPWIWAPTRGFTKARFTASGSNRKKYPRLCPANQKKDIDGRKDTMVI